MDLLATDFQKFIDIMNTDVVDTFFKHEITLRKRTSGVDPWNENHNGHQFTDINLKCLINYNYFRTWGTTNETSSGEIDRQTMVAIFNIKYLADLSLCTPNGNLDFNPATDRFIDKGILYKDSGNTDVSQSGANPLFFMVVLKRDNIATTDTRDNILHIET